MGFADRMRGWLLSTAQSRPGKCDRDPKRRRLKLELELLEGRFAPSAITWAAGSGNWDNPANWNPAQVPGSGDDAVISTTTAATITIQAGDIEAVNSLTTASDDTLAITGGSLTIGGAASTSILSGPLHMTGGSLTTSGSGASVTATGTTTASQVSLYAQDGASLKLPQLASYADPSINNASPSYFAATGAGTLDLPLLNTLGQVAMVISANQGSQVDLPALTVIRSANQTPQNVSIQADGSGSTIDLSGLTSFTGASATYSGLSITNQATLLDEQLSSMSGVAVTLDGAGIVATSQWASLTKGSLTVTGGDFSLANLTDVDSSDLMAQSGGILALPNLGAVTDPHATGFLAFEATGAGSKLELPALNLLGQLDLRVWALQGGEVDMPDVTAISSTGETVQQVSVEANGDGSIIDLSGLTSFTGGSAADSAFIATNQATILDGSLTRLSALSVTLDGTAAVSTSAWESLTDGSLAVTGGSYSLANLIDVDGSSLLADDGGDLTLPNLSSYANPANSNGSATFAGIGSGGPSSSGGILELPALTSVGSLANGLQFQVNFGGEILMPLFVPSVSFTNAPSINIANNTNVSVSGTGTNGSSISVTITDGTDATVPATTIVNSSGAWSVSGIDASGLADGPVTYSVTATFGIDNTDTITQSVPKITVAPAVAFTSTPAISNANVSRVSASGTGDNGDTISVTITDGTHTTAAARTTVSGGAWSVSGINASSLSNGAVTYAVNESDAAGNTITLQQAATKYSTPILVKSSTANLLASAASFVINGSGFNSNIAADTVVLSSGSATVIRASATSLTVSVSGLIAGPLTAVVGEQAVISASTPVATVVPVVTSNTASLGVNQTSLIINGFGFDPATTINPVTLSGHVTGSVSIATTNQLMVTNLSGLKLGALTASVDFDNETSGAAVRVATVRPVVTSSTTDLAANATTLLIQGFGFSTIAANDTVTFGGGAIGRVASALPTQLTVTGLSGLVAGNLSAIVTVSGWASASEPIAVVQPVITARTANVLAHTASLVIHGFGFSSIATKNQVTLSGDATGRVTSATATTLTVSMLGGLTAGPLSATVVSNAVNGASSEPVATVIPVVTKSTESLEANTTNLIITGYGFDLTPGNNIVTFNGGIPGIVTRATVNQLIVTSPGGLTPGTLTASVKVDGQTSGPAVQVATVKPSLTLTTVSFLLLSNGQLWEYDPAGTTFVSSGVASVSAQSTDSQGHATVDLITASGVAYEYHDGVGLVYLDDGVRAAVCGQGVSYVLLTNGYLDEYNDATMASTYIDDGVSTISAALDAQAGNAVDLILTTGVAYEYSDSSGWYFIASNVARISGGPPGMAAYVTTIGKAYLFSQTAAASTLLAATVAQVAIGADQSGNVLVNLLYTNGELDQDQIATGQKRVKTGVLSMSKPLVGVFDVVLIGGYASALNADGAWTSLTSGVSVAV